MAVTLSAHNGYNERFAPPGAKKAYVARITGRDSKMTFAREFLGNGNVLVDDAGLYEVRNTDKKGRPDDDYVVVLEIDGEPTKSTLLGKEEAMKIAKALETRSIDACVEFVARPSRRDPAVTVYDAFLITAKKAEIKAVAKTIDDVTDACWTILQTLPEATAKKVLAALKARVSPKAPPAAVALPPETPVGVVNDAAQDAGAPPAAVGMDQTPTLAQEWVILRPVGDGAGLTIVQPRPEHPGAFAAGAFVHMAYPTEAAARAALDALVAWYEVNQPRDAEVIRWHVGKCVIRQQGPIVSRPGIIIG